MAASYGFDISHPAANAKEAVQWLYFGYLAGVKEQNGAAMSLGRTSTFLDVYFERDLASGVLTEQQAQEIVDDFVIKLRIVRFLRTPEYDKLFAGDPTWVTESIAGMGDDGRSLVTKTSFRLLHTLYNLGPVLSRTSRSGTRRACPMGSGVSPPKSRSTPAHCSSRATRSCGAHGETTAPLPVVSHQCSSASRCSSLAPGPISRNVCSMRSMVAGTKSAANRSGRASNRWQVNGSISWM